MSVLGRPHRVLLGYKGKEQHRRGKWLSPSTGGRKARTGFFLFLMWTILRVSTEFATMLPLLYVLVFWPRGMRDLSSPTRDQTRNPCFGRPSPNHWTAREVPGFFLNSLLFSDSDHVLSEKPIKLSLLEKKKYVQSTQKSLTVVISF